MGRIERTPQATRDLKEIWQYIATDFEPAADKWAAKIEQVCARIAQMPFSGRSRPDLGDNLRSVACGNYLIVYRPSPEGVQLIRVLHGARDLTAIFDND